jgi:autoinducer 2-degrading protein
MLIVHVNVRVKPHLISQFIEATLENARLSLRETGVVRFDFLRDNSEPAQFVLNEVYRSAAAALEHKATAHYLAWRERVAEMMAEPRSSRQFVNIFPGDEAF